MALARASSARIIWFQRLSYAIVVSACSVAVQSFVAMTHCVLWLCVLVILLGSRKRLLALEQSQDSYGLKIGSYIYIYVERTREGLDHILQNVVSESVETVCMGMFVGFTLTIMEASYKMCIYGIIYSYDFLYISMILQVFL